MAMLRSLSSVQVTLLLTAAVALGPVIRRFISLGLNRVWLESGDVAYNQGGLRGRVLSQYGIKGILDQIDGLRADASRPSMPSIFMQDSWLSLIPAACVGTAGITTCVQHKPLMKCTAQFLYVR